MESGVGRLTVRASPGVLPSFDPSEMHTVIQASASRQTARPEPFEAVYLVRSLSVEITLSSHGSDAPQRNLADLGEAMPGAIRSAMSSPGNDVRFFATFVEYLVDFLRQILNGRPIDAWIYEPLKHLKGHSFVDTLGNVADHEPEAWPHVQHAMAGDLSMVDSPLLSASKNDNFNETNESVEAVLVPLFHHARAILLRGISDSDRGPSERSSLTRLDMKEIARRFASVSSVRPIPFTPGPVGRSVAEAVAWLIESVALPATFDTEAARRFLDTVNWYDVAPVLQTLEERDRHVSRSHQPSALAAYGRSIVQESPVPTNATRLATVNRTLALAWLKEARTLASQSPVAGPRTAEIGEPDAANDVSSKIGPAAQTTSALRPLVDRLLKASPLERSEWLNGLRSGTRSEDSNRGGSASSSSTLAEDLGRVLTVDERRAFAQSLEVVLRGEGPGAAQRVESGAVGLLLLMRPLIDLSAVPRPTEHSGPNPVTQAALFQLAERLAGPLVARDAACRVFAYGSIHYDAATQPAAAVEAEMERLAMATEDRAQRGVPALGMSNAPSDPSVGAKEPSPGHAIERLERVLCHQFTRWLRGFEQSSVPYVLTTFVRRRGIIEQSADYTTASHVAVRGGPTGYEVPLRGAGYLDRLEGVPWWPTSTSMDWSDEL